MQKYKPKALYVCALYILPSVVACGNTQMRENTHTFRMFLSSVLPISVCWKWGLTALSWSSTRRPSRSTSRYCCTFLRNTLAFIFFFFSFIKLERIRLQVGANTMDNPLLKYSAKEYFFKASLCHFIVDELNAKVSFSLCYSVLGLGIHGWSSF